MRYLKVIFLLATIVCLIPACNKQGKNDYVVQPPKILENGIRINAAVVSNLKEGTIALCLSLKNNSKEDIVVDYLNCNLKITDDRDAPPEIKKTYNKWLKKGDQETYEIIYHPVNSLKFYKKLNFHGDMKQRYIIKLDFLTNSAGEKITNKYFTLELSDSFYQQYLFQYGKEKKIQLFEFGFESESFVASQKLYFNKKISGGRASDCFMFVSDPQINIDNRMVNINSYKMGDTLMFNMMVTNMGPEKLKILLNRLNVQCSGQSYLPAQMTSEYLNYNQIIDSATYLNQGARFNLQLKYFIPGKIDGFKFATDWLLINYESNNYKRLLYTDLLFRKSDPNNPVLQL